MKKTAFILVAAVALTMSMASCHKDAEQAKDACVGDSDTTSASCPKGDSAVSATNDSSQTISASTDSSAADTQSADDEDPAAPPTEDAQ